MSPRGVCGPLCALAWAALFAGCGTDVTGLGVNVGGFGGMKDTGAAGSQGKGGSSGAGGDAANGGTAGAIGSGGAVGSGGSGSGGSGGSGSGGSSSGGSGSGGSGSGGSGSGGSGGSAQCPGTATGCVISWAGRYGSPGYLDATGTAARFDALGGITGDGTYIYVTANSAVRRITIATGEVTTLAGRDGTPGFQNSQTGSLARFGQFIDGIATDGVTVWVADVGNDLIRAVNAATGAVRTVAGSLNANQLHDGNGANATFQTMRGMTFDGKYLYVTDTTNHAIRRIDPVSRDVVTIAGNNGQGAMDGAGDSAQFNRPRDVHAFDGATLYVGDTENHLVRSIVLGGPTVSTTAGSVAGYKDDIGTMAEFRRLRGITNDGSALIVADSDNFVLRKIELPGGSVSTIAGTAGAQAHLVGIGAAARFDKPLDIHYDAGTGDLFIVEGTAAIRRMYYK